MKKKDHPTNLAEALQAEIKRVRDEVMPPYYEIGKSGTFALTMMRTELDAAVKALAEQDATQCMNLLERLRSFKI